MKVLTQLSWKITVFGKNLAIFFHENAMNPVFNFLKSPM